MIYPFLLMLSGSFRSEMDETDLTLLPRYFYDVDTVYQKFLETKYQQTISDLNKAHLKRYFGFQFVPPPESARLVEIEDFRKFFATSDLPHHWQLLGGVTGTRTIPENLRTYRKRLAERYDGNMNSFSRDVGTSIDSWTQVTLAIPDWLSSRYDMPSTALMDVYIEMLEESDLAERQLVSISGDFLANVVYPRYGDIGSTNKALGLRIDSFSEFRLPARVPPTEQDEFRRQWIDYVLEDLNLSFLVVDSSEAVDYQAFLRDAYANNINELNRVWESDYKDFDQIPLPSGEWLMGGVRSDYKDFLITTAPERWRIVGPEYKWFSWLKEKYEDLESLAATYGAHFSNWEDFWMPLAALEYHYAEKNRNSLRYTYAKRNFVNVIDAIFLEGRIFANTVIFCTLAVLFALLVNPLAAYALSRFQMPGTYKILLMMMAVMAFPPMVTTIPVFIMMQNMGLMNTFAGLLLPGIANGYLIYLLKGFFDSLPKELYEAAQIEGASEFRMFFQITMALSKPILAVVALTAFNTAYSTFLFALIIAPEQDMWLLSVWLYQYRETVSFGGVFASVLVASIPPIIVFLIAQKVILRGIVVPVEK